jgi:sulfatase modifying factor 1
MKKALVVFVLLVVTVGLASGAVVRGIEIDFVTIGNAGNAPDPATGGLYGAVCYSYAMSKYEITNAQWTSFVAAAGAPTGTSTNPYNEGAYFTGAQQPANYVSWLEAAQFCNWLTSGDKSSGAYQFSGNNANPGSFLGIDRDAAVLAYGTIYVIPTEDEWYKAAYHKNDGVTANYWLYPTQSNNVPSNDLINPDPGNNANFYQSGYTIGSPDYMTIVGEFENSESAYGTFDQGGNAEEWTETFLSGSTSRRIIRGGHFMGTDISSSYRNSDTQDREYYFGFRVAMVPEPATIALLAAGLLFIKKTGN